MNKLMRLLKDRDERNLLINIALAFVVKGLSLIVSFFSMPLYIKYFSNDQVLGVWYTVLSLLSWINVCDLGLGNGLRNRLTENLSNNDLVKGKQNVSSTYILLAIVILPVMVIGSVVLAFLDLNTFFQVSKTLIDPKTFNLSIIILFNGVTVNFVLRTINSIIYAIQKSSLNNVLSLIVSLLPVIFILFYNGEDIANNFLLLSIVHAVAVNLPLIIVTIILFSTKLLKKVRPSFKSFSFSTAKGVVGFGVKFFLVQCSFMLLMSTNEIFITKIFGSADVVDYSIYYRLFMLVGSLFNLALTPLWSKVTKDLVEKKYSKIQKTNKVLYLFSLIAIVGEFLMIPLLNFVMKIWLGDEAIAVNYIVAFIFAGFGSAYIINVVLTTVANGIGSLKSQIVFYGIGAILKIPGTLLLKLVFNHWSIVVLYNIIILIAFCIYQFIWVDRKLKSLVASQKTDEINSESEESIIENEKLEETAESVSK